MASFKQEMPPSGGYGPIQIARLARRGPNGYKVFATFFVVSGVNFAGWCYERSIKRKNWVEMNDGRLALEPFLLAERNRAFLKQCYLNREEENELMKDVPGWITGTYYGQPTYHNVAERNKSVKPEEYYMHNKWKDMYDRMFEKRWH